MSPTTLLPPPRPARLKSASTKPTPGTAAPPTAVPPRQPQHGLRQPQYGLNQPIGGPDGGAGLLPDPAGWPTLVRITVDQYHEWIESGLLPTNPTVELIDGLLVRKDRSHVGENPMSIGDGHRFSVGRLGRLDARAAAGGCFVQTQQPVAIPTLNEPEPDAAFIRGTDLDYVGRKPGPADVTCVVEVSDASLATDRRVKLPAYAAAGIPQAVIVNLRDDVIEDYRDPTPDGYGLPTVRRRGETVTFVLAHGATLVVDVAELLPPPRPAD